MTLPADPSIAPQAGFVLLSIAMAGFFAWWTKHRALPAIWLIGTGVLAALGVFQHFVPPPRLLLLFLPSLVAMTWLAWRSDWHRSPLKLNEFCNCSDI